MTSRQPFPKICVALGLPRVETLLEHAKREIENGETFLEFRLDYLDQPEKGLPAIKAFLAAHPDFRRTAKQASYPQAHNSRHGPTLRQNVVQHLSGDTQSLRGRRYRQADGRQNVFFDDPAWMNGRHAVFSVHNFPLLIVLEVDVLSFLV